MATLRTPDGAAVKDNAGNDIKIGGLVDDDMLGQGFARGVVSCVGGGFNVVIDWRQPLDSEGGRKPPSRGARHLTRSGGAATTMNFTSGVDFESGAAHRRRG
eukprot:7316675-Prymnesium_polylepis.1